MSRTASTDERTEEFYLSQISPHHKSAVSLELFNTTLGEYEIIEDLDTERGVSWSVSGKKEKFSNFSLVPLAGTIDFQVVNKNGEYSNGSGTTKENKIDNETKIRLKAGYLSKTAGSNQTSSLNLFDTAGTVVKSFFWRTENDGSGNIGVTATGVGSDITHFADLFVPLYDSTFYDISTYAPDAYTVQTYDSLGKGYQNIVSFTVTTNTAAGIIYYRTINTTEDLDYSQSTNWTNAGATINGTQSVTVGASDRYIQIAVVFDGISYADSISISDITVTYAEYIDWLYTSVYYLDTPQFTDPPAPQMPMIICKGRDAFKRAIGIDVNVEDLSAGVQLDDLIKSTADKVGIKYTAASIADLSSFNNRILAKGVEIKKADKIFDLCMQIINTTGYQMYMEYDSTEDENVLFVQPKPVVADADGAFSFRNYVSIGNNSRNADKILSRLTVLDEQQVSDKEDLLYLVDIVTTGNYVLSWAETGGGEAEFKRITIDQPDEVTISNLSVEPTQISFDVDALSTGGVTLTVYGNFWKNDEPNYEGEAIDLDNMIEYKGTTAKLINPLVVSNAECKSIAESFINQFGTPAEQSRNLIWPYLYLLPEVNDNYLMWRRFIFNDNLFFVTKIKYNWSINNESTQFDFDDSGLNFTDLGDFIYDDIMDYDKGFLYDMGISTPLSTNAEIDAASDAVRVRNVDTV
jgi:hypothetical protein